MNKVEEMFVGRGLVRAGIQLFSKNDALTFIAECRKYRIRILGVDGFYITQTSTQPSLEDSEDYSTVSFTGDSYERAIVFIESRSDDLYFEVVCE